jgi:hypothetical protein
LASEIAAFTFDRAVCQKNLAALRESDEDLSATLEETLASWSGEAESTLCPSTGPKGAITLVARDDQGEFRLHSPYDPVTEAERQLKKITQGRPSNEVPVIVGFGLGYIVEQTAAATWFKRAVVLEPNEGDFLLALGLRDLSGLLRNERLSFVVGHDASASAVQISRALAKRQHYAWHPWITPAMARRHLAFSKECFKDLSSTLTVVQTTARTKYSKSQLFQDNAIENLPDICGSRGVSEFEGVWADKPVVVVAAGPSLDKQMAALKEVSGRILLIAVGQAWRSLRAAGIVPEFVVSVDPNQVMLAHFEGVEPAGEWLIADSCCYPEILSMFYPRLIVGHATEDREVMFDALCGPRGGLRSGGSVANSAFSFAMTMGANPVILIGQDLAFTGGRSHVEGNVYGKNYAGDLARQRGMRPVAGYYDDEVYTNSQMDAYRLWFESQAVINEDLTLINATEGGAKIKGAEQMPFSEVIARYAEDAPGDLLQTAFEQTAGSEVLSSDQLEKNFAKMTARLERIESHAQELVTICQQLLRGGDPHGQQRLWNRFQAAKKKVLPDEGAAWVVLSHYLGKASIRVQHIADQKEDGRAADFLDVGMRYYRAIAKAANYSADRFREIWHTLASRAERGSH